MTSSMRLPPASAPAFAFTPASAPVFALVLALGLAAVLPGASLAQTPPAQSAPAPAASNALEVNVDRGVVAPLPIAVPPFLGKEVGADIARVIAADLQRSGYFRPVNASSLDAQITDANVPPRFADWRGAGAQALVTGQVVADTDGHLRVDFRLWDVFNEQQLVGYQFSASADSWRRVAHKIADMIYKRLTGEDGYFDTRIVFVSESGPRAHRTKRLAIMDQDGANPSFLTDGPELVMTPRISPNGQEITYVALSRESARVWLFNLRTNRKEVLGDFPGMVFAPRFSPDGGKVAFSVDRNGNSDIFLMDLRSRQTRRLTTDPGIDTSPSFSPDGSKIVFNSDRGGSPQLYVMDADGSGVRRISFGEGRYTTPVWSPKGDLIAFTKQTGGQFHIGVMRPDGSDERLLTDSYLDEAPSWAPNGRVIVFSRETRGGGARLYTVDVSGRNLQPAPYSAGATDPAWSPLLK